jgi:RNA polymerase sigma-70 factor (ECF subfamily)
MTAVDTLRTRLAEIAQGKEDALAAFYDATINRVYGLALRIVREPQAAEDVAAEVYVQVWQQASAYSAERGSPLAWLLVPGANRRRPPTISKHLPTCRA